MMELTGNLTLSVVTPEGPLYKGDADFVSVPAWDGELGVLPRHSPIVATLGTGELRIRREGEVLKFAVRGGFLQVVANQVSLLVSDAAKAADLDADALAAERKEILADLRHPFSDDAYEELLARRRWVEVRAGLLT